MSRGARSPSTPILVIYRFPDKALLLGAAAQPVIEAYAADVRAILRSRTEPDDRPPRLTSLFLTFNGEQGFILDHYREVSHAKQRDDDVSMLIAIDQELPFFDELIGWGSSKTTARCLGTVSLRRALAMFGVGAAGRGGIVGDN